MTDLEKYIKENPRAFDTEEPREGHELRFAARAGRKSRFRIIATALSAAAVLAVVLILRPASRGDWAAEASTPEGVYMAYLDRYGKNCLELSEYDYDGTLEAITAEAIPLFQQLPDELSDNEKIAILKEYYGSLIEAMDSYRKQLNIQ